MFGCLRRLGCLFVPVLLVAAFLTRESWWTPARQLVERELAAREAGVAAPTDTLAPWERMTPDAAERGERQVRALAAPRGPAYVSLRPGELASYAFLSLATTLPRSAEDAESNVLGDRVYVRSLVSIRELSGALGSAGGILPERDTLQLGGTFEVLRRGRAQFRVQEVRVGNVPLPSRLIPTLVRRVRREQPAGGVSPDGLEIPIPDYIGDVRIARGRITLYKRH